MKSVIGDYAVVDSFDGRTLVKITGCTPADDGSSTYMAVIVVAPPIDPAQIELDPMGATLNIKETELLAVLGPEPIWGQTVYGVTVEAEADYFTDDRGDLSIVGVRDEAECDAIAAMYYATLTELSPFSWQAKVNAQVRVDKRSESTYKTQFRKRQLQFTLPEVLTEDMALERVYMARAIMSMSWRLLEKDMHARWAYAFAQQVSMALTNPALISAAVMARSTMSARDFKTEEECLQTAYSQWEKHVKRYYKFDGDVVAALLSSGDWRDYIPQSDLYHADLDTTIPVKTPQELFATMMAQRLLGLAVPASMQELVADTKALPWRYMNDRDKVLLEEQIAAQSRTVKEEEE